MGRGRLRSGPGGIASNTEAGDGARNQVERQVRGQTRVAEGPDEIRARQPAHRSLGHHAQHFWQSEDQRRRAASMARGSADVSLWHPGRPRSPRRARGSGQGGRGLIDGLQPYPAMKDSGVPWLGEVPEHWRVLPNRAVFTEVKERERPDADMLSVTITSGV